MLPVPLIDRSHSLNVFSFWKGFISSWFIVPGETKTQKKMFYHICFNWFYFFPRCFCWHSSYFACPAPLLYWVALTGTLFVKREREFTVVCEDREWGLGLLRDERVGVCLRLRLQSCDVLMPTMWWEMMTINVDHTAPPLATSLLNVCLSPSWTSISCANVDSLTYRLTQVTSTRSIHWDALWWHVGVHAGIWHWACASYGFIQSNNIGKANYICVYIF